VRAVRTSADSAGSDVCSRRWSCSLPGTGLCNPLERADRGIDDLTGKPDVTLVEWRIGRDRAEEKDPGGFAAQVETDRDGRAKRYRQAIGGLGIAYRFVEWIGGYVFHVHHLACVERAAQLGITGQVHP